MIVSLHTWSDNDRESLIVLCNAVDRTFLSDRLPYPYTEADADWWLGMVAENEGKEGAWRAIVMDGQIVGSISVERMAEDQRNVGSIGYMILTPFWSQGIGTEAVRQICGISWLWNASSAKCSRRTWPRPGCWRKMDFNWRRRRAGLS